MAVRPTWRKPRARFEPPRCGFPRNPTPSATASRSGRRRPPPEHFSPLLQRGTGTLGAFPVARLLPNVGRSRNSYSATATAFLRSDCEPAPCLEETFSQPGKEYTAIRFLWFPWLLI